MTFKEFTDRLMAAGVTSAEIAVALGVTQSTVLRARMDPDESKHARNPPEGWEPKLRELARNSAPRLQAAAADLAHLADS